MRFPKKSLGQNFLIDKNIIKKIVKLACLKNRNIVEIGPGKGALTCQILNEKPKSLILIEKDNHLAEELKAKFFRNKIIKIYNSDIINFDLEKVMSKNSIVFGNLPYNISSQILVKMIKFKNWKPKYNDLIFMFQREMGYRILGKYKTKNYGRLSVLSKYRLDILNKFFVSPNCFFPKPKVISMVIHFKPKVQKNFKIENIKNLEKITNIFFSNKRKMVNKTFKKLSNKFDINEVKNLNLKSRPSDLKPEIFYRITELFENN